jgi:hypothetical protein
MEENALNAFHLKNVPGRPPPPKKKKKEIKKRRKTTKISCPILHEKLRCRNERRRLKGRFSFGSVDFFTNILLIEIMIANPNRLRVLKKEQKKQKPVLVDVVEDDDRIGMFLYYCHACLL